MHTTAEDRWAFELTDVGKTFGRTGSITPSFTALRGVNLKVPSGVLTTIVGPSGSGKSTLLGLLGLLDRPTSGAIRITGHDTANLSERQRCALRARHLGFVFQAFHLMPDRTVLDNVMLGGLYRGLGRRKRQQEALQRLDDVGLQDKFSKSASTLSGGERQRVAIARALVGSPGILLCDEPTGNLDSRNGELIVEELGRLAHSGITVVVVTHDAQIADLGTYRVHVRDGQVTADDARAKA